MKQTLADALAQRGYDTLTPVQQAVTDPALGDADLLVSSQTGSGKTVGFGLALGDTLLGDADSFAAADAPLALVIAPTRELAMQVKRELGWLYGQAGVVMASCVGGMDMRDERRALARGAHIVVATPGRLRDHIMRGSIDLSQVRGVVLDEADEMLDLGFREDLEYILGEAPEDRRTLLFSATVPRSIVTLAQKYQRDAQRISTVSGESQHADIAYLAHMVAARDSENAIINILRFHEAPNAIVFCNTRAMVARVTTRLSNRGFRVVALSGELSQSERTHALQAMRDGRAQVCVATDVAARGIDLPGLDLVVHAELPKSHEGLLHRSGRTGRAGRKGVSALIITPRDRRRAESILHRAKLTAEWVEAPSADAVRERDHARMLADPAWSEPVADNEVDAVAGLVDQFSPEQLAAAYLRLYAARVTAPEELSDVAAAGPDKPRGAFGPSVWFSVSGGRNQNVEVRRLMPILCKAGNIGRDDLGAIRIQNDETFVEVLQPTAPDFITALGDMTIEGGLKVTALDSKPDLASGPRPAFGGKPKGKAAGKSFAKSSDAPKPRWDSDKPSKPAPKRDKPAAPKQEAAPIEWNDAPAPKPKKPKPSYAEARKSAPKYTPMRGKTKPKTKMDAALEDGAVTPAKKPRHKPAGKPSGKPHAAGGKAPPVGKPNSKKNKARRAAGQATGKGGAQPPRRKG